MTIYLVTKKVVRALKTPAFTVWVFLFLLAGIIAAVIDRLHLDPIHIEVHWNEIRLFASSQEMWFNPGVQHYGPTMAKVWYIFYLGALNFGLWPQ